MENDNICHAFAMAGAVICGVGAATLMAIYCPIGILELASGVGVVGGAVAGATRRVGLYMSIMDYGKRVGLSTVVGATGLVGGAGAIGVAVGYRLGAAVGYPLQAIANLVKRTSNSPAP
jgi:hypothetical protein